MEGNETEKKGIRNVTRGSRIWTRGKRKRTRKSRIRLKILERGREIGSER